MHTEDPREPQAKPFLPAQLATDAPAPTESLPPRSPSTLASNRWRALWNGPASARRGGFSWHAAWAALLRTCCCGLVAAVLLANLHGRPHVDLYPSYVAATLANEAQWHHIYHAPVWIAEGADPQWDRRATELVKAPISTTSFVYHPWYLSGLRAVVSQLDYPAFQGLSIALNEASIALIGLGLALLLRWKKLPQQLLLTLIVTAASSTQYALLLGQNILPALALALAAALCWQGGAPLLLGGIFAALAWTCKPWCGTLLALCFLSRGIRAGLSTTALLVAVMVVLPEFVLPSVLMHDYHAMNRALANSFVWGQNNLSVLSIIERATAPDWSQHLHDWVPIVPPALHRAAALGASALILAAGASLWWRKQPRPEWTTAAWLAFMLVPLGITWDHYFVFAFPLAALATFSNGVPRLVRASGLALLALLTTLVPIYSVSTEQVHAYLTHPAGAPWLRAIPMTLLVASLLLGLWFGGQVPHSRYAPRVCRRRRTI